MTFKFTKHFTNEFKKLLKKYHHTEEDFDDFLDAFDKNHKTAASIKANIYKIRIKNSDKAKGKREGYRTYYYTVENDTVYFLTIYDKSEKESLDEAVLDERIGLEVL